MRPYPRLRFLAIATISALFWGIVAPVTQAQSVHDLPRSDDFQQAINGIYYPRSSEEFFEDGRLLFEEEIRELEDEPSDRPPILEIDESIMIQQEEWEQRDRWLLNDEIPGAP